MTMRSRPERSVSWCQIMRGSAPEPRNAIAMSRSRLMPGKITMPAFMFGFGREPDLRRSWPGSTRSSFVRLAAREEADDGLADGGRRSTILVGVDVGGHHFGQEVRREVGWWANAARRVGGELQVVDTLNIADAACVLRRVRRVALGGEFPCGELFPALGRLGVSAGNCRCKARSDEAIPNEIASLRSQ